MSVDKLLKRAEEDKEGIISHFRELKGEFGTGQLLTLENYDQYKDVFFESPKTKRLFTNDPELRVRKLKEVIANGLFVWEFTPDGASGVEFLVGLSVAHRPNDFVLLHPLIAPEELDLDSVEEAITMMTHVYLTNSDRKTLFLFMAEQDDDDLYGALVNVGYAEYEAPKEWGERNLDYYIIWRDAYDVDALAPDLVEDLDI